MTWTFGIITAGGNDSRIDKIVSSIETQDGLSTYEIIIVGNGNLNPNLNHQRTRIIPFNESLKANWITRKKNIIAEQATSDNLVIVHDYLAFQPGWYQGFEQLGSDWDVACMIQTRQDGIRFLDWFTEKPVRLLPYSEPFHNDGSQYIPGNAFAVKKQLLLKHPLNEALVWDQAEDVEWTQRVRPKAKIKMNPYSEVRHLKANRMKIKENGKPNFDANGYWIWP